MKEKTIGIGIAGLSMGRTILSVNKNPESSMQVRGICELDETKLEKYSSEFNIGFTTTDFDRLIERPDLDVIAVYTPDHFHVEHICRALEAGKHVLATKPMVNSKDEAAQVLALSRKVNRQVMVGQTRRFLPDIMAAHQLWQSGAMGDPVFIQFSYIHDMRTVMNAPGRGWRKDPEKKKWLVGAACHPIDLALWFGGDVEEVYATANHGGVLEQRSGNNNFLLNLTFTNGAIGRVMSLFSIFHPHTDLGQHAVCGTRGSIVNSHLTIEENGEQTDRELDIPETQTSDKSNTESRLVTHLEDCLLNNRPPSPSAADASKTLAVSLASEESLATHRPVKVDTSWIEE